MNPRVLLAVALTVGLQTLSPINLHAAGAPKIVPKKATPAPVHTTISSISADSITITDAHGTKTYKITKDTALELKGQTVKAEELKAGMRVSVTMGSDPTVASRIAA